MFYDQGRIRHFSDAGNITITPERLVELYQTRIDDSFFTSILTFFGIKQNKPLIIRAAKKIIAIANGNKDISLSRNEFDAIIHTKLGPQIEIAIKQKWVTLPVQSTYTHMFNKFKH